MLVSGDGLDFVSSSVHLRFVPLHFPQVLFNTPTDFKALHTNNDKGSLLKVEFLQQNLKESNADRLYVTAITSETYISTPKLQL